MKLFILVLLSLSVQASAETILEKYIDHPVVLGKADLRYHGKPIQVSSSDESLIVARHVCITIGRHDVKSVDFDTVPVGAKVVRDQRLNTYLATLDVVEGTVNEGGISSQRVLSQVICK
jgi:hypothetical protein